MKRILWGGLFLSGLAGWVGAEPRVPVGFYKPNQESDLVITLKNKVRYSSWHPVTVTVLVTNQGRNPVLMNGRLLFNRYPLPGELAFVIEGPKGRYYPLKKTVTPRDVLKSDLTVLRPGETFERDADLSDMYGVGKRGPYKIQAIYYNGVDYQKDGMTTWRGAIASEPAQITLE